MIDYYDRDLNPMDECSTPKTEWAGKRVLRNRNERGYDVSTVWLPFDHSYDGSSPIVFETLIFKDGEDIAGEMHYSEEGAARWHLRAVDAIRAGLTPTYDEGWMGDE